MQHTVESAPESEKMDCNGDDDEGSLYHWVLFDDERSVYVSREAMERRLRGAVGSSVSSSGDAVPYMLFYRKVEMEM